MNKIKQRIYVFGQIVNGMVITNNIHIENIDNSKVIPITFEDKIIGQCTISTDDNGIICDGVTYNDAVDNELVIGVFYINEYHFKDDIKILDNISIKSITTK